MINWQGSWTGLSPGTVYDNANNSTVCPSNQEVHVDLTKPTISCTTSDANDTDGVKVTISASDTGGSTLASATSSDTNLKSSKTYTATDYAGNSASCTVGITSVTQYRKKTRDHQYKSCANSACGCASHSYNCSGKAYSNLKYTGTSSCTGGYMCCQRLDKGVCEGNTTCANRYCSAYNSCRTSGCGEESFGSWSSWSTTSCTASTNKKCDSRVIYKVS